MPSTLVMPQSGGSYLVSGDVFSGNNLPVGGFQLKLARAAPGPIYVGVRRNNQLPSYVEFSGGLSGSFPTIASGGHLSSGGMLDGIELAPGDAQFIQRIALPSGIQDIKYATPAASSGGRLFYDWY